MIAELPFPFERAHGLTGIVTGTLDRGVASIVHMRKLAGELRVSQGAAMGRIGRVALRPFCEFLVGYGGALPGTMHNGLK